MGWPSGSSSASSPRKRSVDDRPSPNFHRLFWTVGPPFWRMMARLAKFAHDPCHPPRRVVRLSGHEQKFARRTADRRRANGGGRHRAQSARHPSLGRGGAPIPHRRRDPVRRGRGGSGESGRDVPPPDHFARVVVGLRSDDDFEIGRFTVSGTYNLLALGAAVGFVGAGAYRLVGPRLIGPMWFRRVTTGLAAGAVVGSLLVHADGIDFRLLKPTWFAITLFVALPALFATFIGPVVDRAADENT